MVFVPSLRLLACLGEVKQTETEITLPLEAFRDLIQAAFRGDAFDGAWYRAPDPATAQAFAPLFAAAALTQKSQAASLPVPPPAPSAAGSAADAPKRRRAGS